MLFVHIPLANLDKTTNLVVVVWCILQDGANIGPYGVRWVAPTTTDFQVNRGAWGYFEIDKIFYISRLWQPLHGSILSYVYYKYN